MRGWESEGRWQREGGVEVRGEMAEEGEGRRERKRNGDVEGEQDRGRQRVREGGRGEGGSKGDRG